MTDSLRRGRVAYSVALVCADDKGRVQPLAFFDHLVRAALLVDLRFAGRQSMELEGGSVMDTTPTGCAPFDILLRYIDYNPTAPMSSLLGHARVGVADVLGSVGSVQRRSRRRPLQADVDEVRSARAAATHIAEIGRTPSPALAATVALAATARLVDPTHRDSRVAQSGTPSYLLADLCRYIDQLRERWGLASQMSGG